MAAEQYAREIDPTTGDMDAPQAEPPELAVLDGGWISVSRMLSRPRRRQGGSR